MINQLSFKVSIVFVNPNSIVTYHVLPMLQSNCVIWTYFRKITNEGVLASWDETKIVQQEFSMFCAKTHVFLFMSSIY